MWTQRVRKTTGAALLAAMLVVLVTAQALAGGWATVALDELPRTPRAGEALALGFTVRQHGFREIDLDVDDAPVFLFAADQATGETLRFDAVKDGNTGHFLVDVTFPAAGVWAWGVQPGWFPKVELEPLTVLPPAPPAAAGPTPALLQAAVPLWRVILLAVTLVAGVTLVAWLTGARRRRGLAAAVAALCLVLAAGLVAWPQPVDATSRTGSGDAVEAPLTDQVAYGRALFAAKGCTGCHQLAGVSNSVGGPVIGPDLTQRAMDTQFLRAWLADPAALRPATQMPNLGLDSDEIEALVAFLTDD